MGTCGSRKLTNRMRGAGGSGRTRSLGAQRSSLIRQACCTAGVGPIQHMPDVTSVNTTLSIQLERPMLAS